MFARCILFLGLICRSVLVLSSDQRAWGLKNFKSLVAFGDSYTDESRISYFASNNGSAPPVGWANPVNNATSTGGYVWARYVSFYTGANLYNYAVGGAVCSNKISPRIFDAIDAPFPALLEYEVPAFVADKAYIYPENGTAFLDVPSNETIYSMWIGTNDVGNDAFLTESQIPGKTLIDFVECVYQAFDRLYAAGARHFVLMNVIPLNYVPQYALPEDGGVPEDKYFTDKPANATQVSYRMMEQVVLLNDDFKFRTAYETKIAGRYPGAHFAVYDVWKLFDDMYHYPKRFLNGTAPANVETWINQCDDINGTDCKRRPSPDSYLWYDELHPSEQADRVVAQEFVKVARGESGYATYWS